VVDFLIVFKVAGAYARRRGLDVGTMQKTLATCHKVGQGHSVPASWLLRAQTLSMRFWASAGFLLLLPDLLIAGLLALIRPGHAGDIAGAVFIGIFLQIALAALCQVPVQTYRSSITMRDVRRMGGQATRSPLQSGSAGLPKKRDFWLAAFIPIILSVIYLVLRLQYPNA
jgi:hypothetical protein